MSSIDDCQIIQLPQIPRPEGSLSVVEGAQSLPFSIARVYYLYDIPGGSTRGGHAHKELQQFLVAVMGAFDVLLDDGRERKTVRLDRAYYGLYIPKLIWRELLNFSSGAIGLVLASQAYDPTEYIYKHEDFILLKSKKEN